jgi:hypothetical protein
MVTRHENASRNKFMRLKSYKSEIHENASCAEEIHLTHDDLNLFLCFYVIIYFSFGHRQATNSAGEKSTRKTLQLLVK